MGVFSLWDLRWRALASRASVSWDDFSLEDLMSLVSELQFMRDVARGLSSGVWFLGVGPCALWSSNDALASKIRGLQGL